MIATLGACPLCGSPDGDAVLEVAYDDVWDRLDRDWGVVLSSEVRSASAPGAHSTLVRCASCDLERFEPLAPGGPGFYAELMAATPYAEDRWDFAAARRGIAPGDDVVDLGCGAGRFLDSLGARGGRTVGVDHHEAGVAEIVARGGEAYAGSFGDFAEREAGAFDIVTSFHTLEHVGDPAAMVRAAAACLRPRGRLLLSVPNRERTWREEGEPMDRPPHHVTRWGPEQVRRLAAVTGLRVDRIRFEPPGLHQIQERASAVTEARLARLPGGLRHPVGRLAGAASLPPAWYLRRRGSDRFAARGLYGHSMLAVLRAG